MTVYVPAFYEASGDKTTRGIVDITPEGSPFTDPMTARAVLSSFPFMNSLKKEELSKDNFDTFKKTNSKNINVYGFSIGSRDGDAFNLNDDGFYVRYDISQDGMTVGFIEYYYEEKTSTFSYRQIVILTLDVSQGTKPLFYNAIISIEYNDIIVNNDGSFKIGDLDENRELKKNGIVDFYYLDTFSASGKPQDNNKPQATFWRNYVTSQKKGDTYAAFFNPYEKIIIENSKLDSNIGKIDSNSNGIIDTIDEAKKVGLGVAYGNLDSIYTNIENILAHEPGHGTYKGKYESYKEFKEGSLFELKIASDNSSSKFKNIDQPVVMNIKEPETAAYLKYTENKQPRIANTWEFDKANCTAFKNHYGDINSMGTFIEAHLKACGIENTNYIKNYIIAAEYVKNDSKRQFPKVTTEKPENYKASLQKK